MTRAGMTTHRVTVRLVDDNGAIVAVSVELSIDLVEVAGFLGAKAFKNRSGKSTLRGGAIVARILKP